MENSTQRKTQPSGKLNPTENSTQENSTQENLTQGNSTQWKIQPSQRLNPADNLLGRILVPLTKAARPEGKMAAKINLAMMTPIGDGVIPAFPDPLLLAYKSSINWTRYYRFQLMAEAEPKSSDGERLFPDDVFVPSDQASKVSGYSSLY